MIETTHPYSSILRGFRTFISRVVPFSALIIVFGIIVRVIVSAQVRDEEGCGAINPCCSGVTRLGVAAHAQQAAKVRGSATSLAAKASPRDEAFVKQLRDLGWIDGQNIAIEYPGRLIKQKTWPRLPMSSSA